MEVGVQIAGLFCLALLGSFVGVLPVWATCAVYATQLGWSPWSAALVAAVGQCVGYVALHTAGDRILKRWTALARRIADVRERTADALRRGYLPTTACAAVLGLPPMVAVAALAPGFEIRLLPLLCVAFPGRFVRYAVAAGAASTISAGIVG